MDEAVQAGQVCTIDAQQIIRIPRHRPGANDFGAGRQKPRKAGGMFGPVGAQMDLHKPLYRQPQPFGVEPGRLALDIPFGFKPLPPPTCLGRG